MPTLSFEDLEVYQLSEKLADAIWSMVLDWDPFARDTVGRQLVRAADSVGANIAEGSGRGTYKDNKHYARIGRGSFKETRHFLRRAYRRGLMSEEQSNHLSPLIDELGPRLNAYIRSIGIHYKRPRKPETDE
jgi:four helix bundle protein